MIRFMSKARHAYLDYPVAIGLIILPFALGLGAQSSYSLWLSIVTGVTALILTIFTDHKFGLVKLIPYKLHLTIDLGVGLAFIAAPFLLGFHGIEAVYYWGLGATILLVVGLDNEKDVAPAE
jgi:hypothetical protein